MEVESTQGSTSTPDVTPATTVVETPTNAAPASVTTEPGKQTTAAPPAYTPNWKYVAGKEEREIPEMYRPLIKDELTEKQVKDLFQRADGLEWTKQDRANVQEKYNSLKQEHEGLTKSLRTLSDFVNNGDYDSFFQSLGISNEQILRYALEKAQYSDLSPEQKRAYDEAQEAKRTAYWSQQQATQYQQQLQQIQLQQKTLELNQALSMPEVAQIAQAYDQRKGPGAFRNKVIQMGQSHWALTQQDIAAEAVVKQLVDELGEFIQLQQSHPATPSIQQAPKQVPVIPTPGSSGGQSPAARSVKTIEDIEKMYAEKFGTR